MFNNIIVDYYQKWEIKKKQKFITKPLKENYKKYCERIIEIVLKMRKLQKNCASNRKKKNMLDENRKRKKKIYIYIHIYIIITIKKNIC